MRTIIAGSRDITDSEFLNSAISECGWTISEVISGCANGAYKLGEIWAAKNNIPIKKFPANWSKWGKSAGMIRNAEMLKCGQALIALWDGKSRGTKNMIDISKNGGIRVFVKLRQ